VVVSEEEKDIYGSLPQRAKVRYADGKEGWVLIPDACQNGLGERESPMGLWDHIRDPLSIMWPMGKAREKMNACNSSSGSPKPGEPRKAYPSSSAGSS
jgi:hypothetical protein